MAQLVGGTFNWIEQERNCSARSSPLPRPFQARFPFLFGELRWNRPQSVAEEQWFLDAVRNQLEWERQFTVRQFTGG